MVPGRPALDYAGLYHQIRHGAAQLAEAGLKRVSRVAVVLPNGPEMAACCLAVATHAVCAPINPAYRREEFLFYLEDLQADALIVLEDADSPARDAAHELGLTVIELAGPGDAPAGRLHFRWGTEIPYSGTQSPSGSDVALLLHTSGTTSRPKLVPLTHANLCASAFNIMQTLGLGRGDRCLNLMPLFHIHGFVAALLSSLASGGSVVCTPGLDSEQFFNWVNKFLPTWYSAVPTIHQAILQQGALIPLSLPQPGLRFIRSSSAALAPATLVKLEAMFGAPVIEAYGMTEAAHQMTSNPLPPGQRRPGSVGLPAGPEVAIMDTDGGLLPGGDNGEVVIRGANVTPGYDRNPQASAAAFRSGWFRTGDQGRLDHDGYLYLTGRLKEIVNRGGEKVSPREVDEVLLAHPSVSEAIAFAVPHPSLGEDLVAAVVLASAAVTTEGEIRAFAFQHLADHKVPSKVIFVDELPKTATGKVQRLSLATQLADQLTDLYIAPRTDIERLLTEIVGEVLEGRELGIRANFFMVGGDSLGGTRVVVRINARLNLDLPLPVLFHYPTVEQLAVCVDQALADRQAEVDRLIAEIDQLSDEEVERLLKDD